MLWGGGVLGAAILGIAATRHSLIAWCRGVVGAAGGCFVAAGIDFVAVLAQAAILAISDYRAM